ncbi:MAG: fructose-6-phosphate aldolase [Methanomassiliicoccales archaeon]|jgi:transaldolase|nr:fructose-6-phosphate aldolase [Methanomassiliicoccales archaeon]
MKIFIDSANVEQIKEVASWGILDGVTTNPTLVAKEKTDFKSLIRQICDIVDGPISVEAVSLTADEIINEARSLAALHRNIVIKIPMTEEGLKATKKLSEEGIKVNMTLVFSPAQALFAAKAGAKYISPFVGRLDDVGHSGMELVGQILDILDNYDFESEVIVASVRHPGHVIEAAMMGAHIATVPYDVLKKMFRHPLTDVGIERFLKDWEKVSGR